MIDRDILIIVGIVPFLIAWTIWVRRYMLKKHFPEDPEQVVHEYPREVSIKTKVIESRGAEKTFAYTRVVNNVEEEEQFRAEVHGTAFGGGGIANAKTTRIERTEGHKNG